MTEPEEKRTLHPREILRQVLILDEYVDLAGDIVRI